MLRRFEQINENSERQWGKMNVNEMVCHITDQLRMALGEIDYRDKSSFVSRTIIKFLAVYVIQAPKEKVQTLYELDPMKGGTQPTQLEQDKTVFVEKLQMLCDRAPDEPLHAHGTFGKMSRRQWGILIYKHLDHHFRQFNA